MRPSSRVIMKKDQEGITCVIQLLSVLAHSQSIRGKILHIWHTDYYSTVAVSRYNS